MFTIFRGRREGKLGQLGFTLVELLVVVLILGVLAAVVVFSVGGITTRGKSASCQTEVREVRTAIEAWKAQNTGNPGSLQVVVNAGLLETVPNKNAANGNPPSPSAVAGYVYTPATGVYNPGAGSTGCPATG